MDKYYVLVAGKGETSRANLEALMEDHYYSKGAEGRLVVAFKNKPTQAQVFAAQFAIEKKKEVLVFMPEGADATGIKSDISITDNPIEDAVALLKGEDAAIFLLWSDEDPDCTDVLAAAKEADIPVFDLTDGLNPINAVEGVKPVEKVVFPVQEAIPPVKEPEPEPEEDEDEDEFEEAEEDEPDDEDEEDDGEVSSDIYFGIKAIAELVAPIFAKAFVEAFKNGSEGGKA